MADEAESNGENQWIQLELTNRMRKNNLEVKSAWLKFGKFYKGSKDKEISGDEVNRIVIPPGSMDKVNACGRLASPSGTQGSIDLYDGSTRICTVAWDCPWGSSDNDLTLNNYDPGTSEYSVSLSDWAKGGPIGRVTAIVSIMG
ncbi:hypothetical protein CDD82_1707 [Ophiocordyceps australis]|uniref:Asp-hemolysin n=1 Tax=Ophiocordyceps australis TaxID=1399860 RepID=A0A2C5ZHH5_9HYPO|nr:hypothetical protein CDD82_1707 [Ophiocordyceps australis]